VITTNHLASGIYIPPDDRRYDVIDCASLDELGLKDDEKRREYFTDLWEWFHAGGASHVAAFLHERKLPGFSAANGQRKTAAHKTVIAGGMTADVWLEDILDEIEEAKGGVRPLVLRADELVIKAVARGEKEMDARRKLGNAMGRAGYALYRNPDREDGRWKIGGRKVTVYVTAVGLNGHDPIAMLGSGKGDLF
jgi:hypothetical protein